MIISFKYKFIFIKNYKTASSSIESYLYNFLTNKDIFTQTEDHKGINCWGNINPKSLVENFDKKKVEKVINSKMAFFPHMPIWLIKERLAPLEKKLNYKIFKNFYKFAVIRNPFDVVVSSYCWHYNPKAPITFEQMLYKLENNKYTTGGLHNLNRVMDLSLNKIICDKILKYENLNGELDKIFKKLGIPFGGKLEIFKKKTNREKDYRKFYNERSINLINDIFRKEIKMFDYKF
jgi:hypothetical protein|tara:strand:+ start:332 stop:1033 length:702 start_codon:yes stop_codon:yes gene_type:complete